MTNRRDRRAAARAKGGPGRPNASKVPSPVDHDRVFQAPLNYQASGLWTKEAFSSLHAILGLIETALHAAETPDRKNWFPNNIAAHACLIRAYQGLQAAANLCALGFYVESRTIMRTVYETAGLARALAHRPEVAERWLHGGDWVRDKFSRDFWDEIDPSRAGSDEPSPHKQMYQLMCQYAHPMATSCLEFLFDPDGRPQMYPQADEKQFRDTARIITVQALFVAFALRNASAGFDAIPGLWHSQLAELARQVTGLPLEHLNRDWDEHQRQFERLQASIRHDEELNDALRDDPNSHQNLRTRAGDGRAPD